MEIKFDVINAEELAVRLERKITDGDRQALQRVCALVEGEAKRLAPKDTGALRRSIASKIEESSDGLEGIVFTPLEYAPYVEYGTGLFAEKGGRKEVPWVYEDDKGEFHSTRGQHPQPYMRPALENNRERILEILKGGLE